MAKRYMVKSLLYAADIIGVNSYPEIDGALNMIKENANNPRISNEILVDTQNKIVEIVKGDTIVPFKDGLDFSLKGWKMGKVRK